MATRNRGLSGVWTLVLIVALCAAGSYVAWKYSIQPNDAQAQEYNRVFAAIERGDSAGRVAQLMGTPTTVHQGDDVLLTNMAWNTSGYGQGNRCETEYVYHMPYSIFWNDWIIGFDSQDRVIAKYHGN